MQAIGKLVDKLNDSTAPDAMVVVNDEGKIALVLSHRQKALDIGQTTRTESAWGMGIEAQSHAQFARGR
jgi:hypothetical protein